MFLTLNCEGLTKHHIDELFDHALDLRIMMLDPSPTYECPEHGWTCFHCGITFKSIPAARSHFGDNPSLRTRPVCVDATEQLFRIAEALNTDETGDNLVAVAKAAHFAERDLTTVRGLIRVLRRFTDEQRTTIFAAFCTHCGNTDPACVCMKDE